MKTFKLFASMKYFNIIRRKEESMITHFSTAYLGKLYWMKTLKPFVLMKYFYSVQRKKGEHNNTFLKTRNITSICTHTHTHTSMHYHSKNLRVIYKNNLKSSYNKILDNCNLIKQKEIICLYFMCVNVIYIK